MSTFNVEIFLGDLKVNLNEAKLNNCMPVDYEKFYNTFKKVVDKFAPLRKPLEKKNSSTLNLANARLA